MSPDSETMHLLRWRKSKDEQIRKERKEKKRAKMNKGTKIKRGKCVNAKETKKTAKGRNSWRLALRHTTKNTAKPFHFKS